MPIYGIVYHVTMVTPPYLVFMYFSTTCTLSANTSGWMSEWGRRLVEGPYSVGVLPRDPPLSRT